MKTVWLASSLLLASCLGAPDTYHVFGTWDEGADVGFWPNGKDGDIGESYGLGIGVSGPIFSRVTRQESRLHPRPAPIGRQEVPEPVVDDHAHAPIPGDSEGEAWWQNEEFRTWLERFVLAALFVIVGRHGEDAYKKTASQVKKYRSKKTTPSP